MEPVNHEPRQYSSKESAGQRLFNYLITIFMLAFSLIMLGFGLYYRANPLIEDSDILAAILIPLSIIIGILAFCVIYFTNHHQRYEYRFILSKDGIFEEKIYPKKDKAEKSQILFEDMTKVLIGNYVEYVSIYRENRNLSHFNFGAILIITHKDGTFLRVIFDQDDLDLWTARIMDKKVPIYYTEYNLIQAVRDQVSYPIDFNEIDAVPLRELKVLPSIGHSEEDNPYIHWEPKDIKEMKDREKLRKTKKAQKNVLIILFFYAIIIGGIFFGLFPIHEHGETALTGLSFFFVFLVNIFIPIIGVFWRSFTKWHILFVHFFVVTVGNVIGLSVVILMTNNPIFTNFIGIISLNFVILFFGWLPGLLIIKGIKFLLHCVNKNKI